MTGSMIFDGLDYNFQTKKQMWEIKQESNVWMNMLYEILYREFCRSMKCMQETKVFLILGHVYLLFIEFLGILSKGI